MESLLNGIKHLLVAISGALVIAVPHSAVSNPTPTPNTTDTIIIASKSAELEKLITISGSYTYIGQELRYSVNTPKSGGEISGEVSGLCNGSTEGKFEGGEGGKIEGRASADCGIGFIRQKVNVSYTGRLFPEKKLMEINWNGQIPYFGDHGSFSYSY